MLLKKTKITQFKELFWKIKIQQRKEMLSMNNKIPRVKKSGHLLPVLPLIPQKTTKMEEEKGCWKPCGYGRGCSRSLRMEEMVCEKVVSVVCKCRHRRRVV